MLIDTIKNDPQYADVILFANGLGYAYETAFIGIKNGRAIYDYELMIEYLMATGDFKHKVDAIEWIEYNTLRALPYLGDKAPIIYYPPIEGE